MLSIIVSSISSEVFQAFEKNVSETIGAIPYEILKKDNWIEKKSIPENYNALAAQAQYSFLCFMHQDVKFITKDWGEKLIQHLERPEAGIVGIAGSVYKSRMLTGWWQTTGYTSIPERINIFKWYGNNRKPARLECINPKNEPLAQVAAVDGVLMAMQAGVWLQHPFDEELVPGLHGYDLDICLAVGSHRKNYVAFDILLEHFSEGNPDVHWVYSMLKVHRKWKQELPRCTDPDFEPAVKNFKEDISYSIAACKAMIQDHITYAGLIENYKFMIGLLPVKKKYIFALLPFLSKSFLYIHLLYLQARFKKGSNNQKLRKATRLNDRIL